MSAHHRHPIFAGSIALLIFGLLALIVLHIIENFRGEGAWEAFRKQEPSLVLNPGAFETTLVADATNFAKIPLFQELYTYELAKKKKNGKQTSPRLLDIQLASAKTKAPPPRHGSFQTATAYDFSAWQAYYRTIPGVYSTSPSAQPAEDVLIYLQRYQPILQELTDAAKQHSSARYPAPKDGGATVYDMLLNVARVYSFRASAEVAANQMPAALTDVEMIFFLANTLEQDSSLQNLLTRCALVRVAIQPIWEGMVRHQWSDEYLYQLQKDLGRYAFLVDYTRVVQVGRANLIDSLGKLIPVSTRWGRITNSLSSGDSFDSKMYKIFMLLAPGGWYQFNRIAVSRWTDAYLLVSVDARNHLIHKDIVEASIHVFDNASYSPFEVMAARSLRHIEKTVRYTAMSQVIVEEAFLACALERYAMHHQTYPDTLQALMPEFVTTLPSDVMTGAPLFYKYVPGKPFILYSVGWDMVDNQGSFALQDRQQFTPDTEKGDWVWFNGAVAISQVISNSKSGGTPSRSTPAPSQIGQTSFPSASQ